MDGSNPYAPPTRDPAPASPVVAGAPVGAPGPWTISEVLNVGFDALKRRPVELIGGFFLVTLLGQIPAQLPTVLTLTQVIQPGSTVAIVTQVVCTIGALFVGSFFWVGQLRVVLAAARQEPFDFGLYFSGGDRFLAMLAVNFLVYLGVALGMVLLIVPGIVLALGWALAGPLVVDANYSAVEALRESWEAMRGQKMQLFLFGLVASLVCFAGMCACYVGIFVVAPALLIAYAEVYRRITGRMSGGALAGAQAAFAVPTAAGSGYMTPPRTH